MVRSERRNAKKSKKGEEEKKEIGARGGFIRMKMKFRVPNRYGAKLPYRRRGRGARRPMMPSFTIPMGGLMPLFGVPMPMGAIRMPLPGVPPGMPMPGMPGMFGLPVGLPPMSMPPVGVPPMIPMMPPSSVSLPFPSSVISSRPPLSGARVPRDPPAPIPTMPARKIRAKKAVKVRSNAFKIQSPEQIALKCARQAAKA